MFATFGDIDRHFPVAALRDGHIETMQALLQAPRA
jgi:hypothetical protein